MRRLPPLNALRAFDAAARQLSISAAAQELHVTHSAVSHQVRQLEQWLGKSLFVRHAGGVRLTAEGQSLKQAVDHTFSTLVARCAEIAEQEPISEIVLGAPGSFFVELAYPAARPVRGEVSGYSRSFADEYGDGRSATTGSGLSDRQRSKLASGCRGNKPFRRNRRPCLCTVVASSHCNADGSAQSTVAAHQFTPARLDGMGVTERR
jgi:Bacterial regulatory helix-turn-helix protein, lysR family